MPENKEKEEETQGTQQTQGTPGTVDAIKAELQAEGEALRAARSNLEHTQAIITEKDRLVADLQAQLGEARQATESLRAEGAATSDRYSRAVSRYLEMARALNSAIPGDVIAGSTIEEIDTSLAKAKAIAESVERVLEARAKEARVPAGAPTRGEIPLEGLSPREKIAAGIQQGSQR